MKKFITLLCVFIFGFAAQAQEPKVKGKYDVTVSGNCELCKKRIEKAALAVPGVRSAEWHADDQMLHLLINENKTDVKTVEAQVAKTGHDTKNVKATTADYDNLHGCCKYDRVQ